MSRRRCLLAATEGMRHPAGTFLRMRREGVPERLRRMPSGGSPAADRDADGLRQSTGARWVPGGRAHALREPRAVRGWRRLLSHHGPLLQSRFPDAVHVSSIRYVQPVRRRQRVLSPFHGVLVVHGLRGTWLLQRIHLGTVQQRARTRLRLRRQVIHERRMRLAEDGQGSPRRHMPGTLKVRGACARRARVSG